MVLWFPKNAAIAQLGLPIRFRGQSPHVWGSTLAIDIDKPAKIEIDSVAASEPQAHVPMTAVA